MAVGYDYELYVDGTRVFYGDVRFNIEILSDQFFDVGGISTGSYTYTEGEYAGWTTTQGGTTPDYEVGDTFYVNGQLYLYSIPATTSTGSMYFGTSTISKMYLGQAEVSKVYLGQDLVYEKQAPTTSYNVTISENNTNQSNLNYKSYLKIYDGQDENGTLLVNSTGHTAMSQTSITCTTGYLYVVVCSSLGGGYTQVGEENIVGNITKVDSGSTSSYNAYIIMKIESDGSFKVWTDYNYD